MEMEIWKTIEEYPNYQVSNCFNVKNIKTNRILKPSRYYSVKLNGKTLRIHRLVAEAFGPKIEKNEMELWKTIENHPNYEVSTFGNLRNIKTKRILKTFFNITTGYYQIWLNGKTEKIHRLVAKAFIPKIEGMPLVDHLDRNPLNNHVSNLQWLDHSGNKFNTGLYKNNKSGHKNISWVKRDSIWRVFINIDGVQKHFGSFEKMEDAIKKRDEVYEELGREMVL